MNYTEIVAVLAFDKDLYLAEEWIELWLVTKKESWTASKVPEMIVILCSSSV